MKGNCKERPQAAGEFSVEVSSEPRVGGGASSAWSVSDVKRRQPPKAGASSAWSVSDVKRRQPPKAGASSTLFRVSQ
jgi:hypothetical protein